MTAIRRLLQPNAGGFFFADATATPVEVLRLGTWTDKHGREVVIDGAALDAMVAAFDAGEAGQDVPVDIDHERGAAAGWVTRLWREGERLLAEIDWNEMGRELVGDRVYRYISATINMTRNVIRSISLCNFPAVKGLAPVSLSEGVWALGDVRSVGIGTYIQARLHRLAAEIVDGMVERGEIDTGGRNGLMRAVEEALGAVESAVDGEIDVHGPERLASDFVEVHEEDDDMSMVDQEALRAEVRAEVRAELREELEAELEEARELRDQIRAEEREALEAELAERMARREELREFAEGICSGERALSSSPEGVIAFLDSLPDEHVEPAMGMLQAKVIDLGEHGSSREGAGGRQALPEEFVQALDAGELGVEDLDNPVLGLGDLGQYDLSAWQGDE